MRKGVFPSKEGSRSSSRSLYWLSYWGESLCSALQKRRKGGVLSGRQEGEIPWTKKSFSEGEKDEGLSGAKPGKKGASPYRGKGRVDRKWIEGAETYSGRTTGEALASEKQTLPRENQRGENTEKKYRRPKDSRRSTRKRHNLVKVPLPMRKKEGGLGKVLAPIAKKGNKGRVVTAIPARRREGRRSSPSPQRGEKKRLCE